MCSTKSTLQEDNRAGLSTVILCNRLPLVEKFPNQNKKLHNQQYPLLSQRITTKTDLQVQRKLRISHYGRIHDHSTKIVNIPVQQEIKRCSFITSNSDPIHVAYHDEEWGVPVHEDKLLFELLVLTVAQVGSDWTSLLKKRQVFREAFSGFDVEVVSRYTEKKITSISSHYSIELSLVRGVVDNSNRILEIKKEMGSFDKYLWGFVNNKPMETRYKWWHMIPAKTSKSETISKDMVKRGFRQVGPTVVHSFMQSAGLTNDHLISCCRHRHSPAPAFNLK